MLQKIVISLEEYDEQYAHQAIVVQVNSIEELSKAKEIFQKQQHRLKGVQIHSLLVQETDLSTIGHNYCSIIIDQKNHLPLVLKDCKHKKNFVELIVPIDFIDNDILAACEGIGRVIVEFTEEAQVQKIPFLFSELITHQFYPLTKNLPLCKIKPQHASEVFLRQKQPEKPAACDGCIVKQWCSFQGKGFVPQPIRDNEQYKDLLMFLHNENPLTRF